jgi:hypothetical protein
MSCACMIKAHAWSCAIDISTRSCPRASARTTGERSIRTWSCFSLSACAPPPAPAGRPSPQWSKRRRRDPRSSHVGMHNQRAIYMWSCFSLSACVHRRPSSRSKRCTRGSELYAPAGTCRDSFGTVLVGRVTTYLALTCLLSGRSSLLHR